MCIRDRFVEVEVLLSEKVAQEHKDYEGCNTRVKDLRKFRCLFYREDTECGAERFWRQRLSAANPSREIRRLSRSRVGPGIERRTERARAIHEALSAEFPSLRRQLDANLQSELHRLYLLHRSPLHLAGLK